MQTKVKAIETLACDAGWRNYHFVKLSTEDGVVGWSEFDEGFGSPGVGAVIERLAPRVVGQAVGENERIYAQLHCSTRPGSGRMQERYSGSRGMFCRFGRAQAIRPVSAPIW